MDHSHQYAAWRPSLLPHHHHHHHCHHHRHSHQPSFGCFLFHHHHNHHHHIRLHHHHHHHRFHCHLHPCPNFTSVAQKPEPVDPIPLPGDLNSKAFELEEAQYFATQKYQEEEIGALENEEDDDPIFILTDEWREFFGKAEAKRKLEKQAKLKGNTK